MLRATAGSGRSGGGRHRPNLWLSAAASLAAATALVLGGGAAANAAPVAAAIPAVQPQLACIVIGATPWIASSTGYEIQYCPQNGNVGQDIAGYDWTTLGNTYDGTVTTRIWLHEYQDWKTAGGWADCFQSSNPATWTLSGRDAHAQNIYESSNSSPCSGVIAVAQGAPTS